MLKGEDEIIVYPKIMVSGLGIYGLANHLQSVKISTKSKILIGK